MRGLFVAILAVTPIACSTTEPAEPAPRPVPAIPDAASRAPAPQPPPLAVTGSHLDDDGYRPAAPQGGHRPARPIDVILRSTPIGAQAAVDGLVIGPTPAYWNGNADGREHEFTFVMANHAIARYRFVPITSGTIHARLIPVSEDVNAGTPPPEIVSPSMRQPDPPPMQPDAPLIAPLPDAAPTGAIDPPVSLNGSNAAPLPAAGSSGYGPQP